jgi:hypothetical protein
MAAHRGETPGGSSVQLELRWSAVPDDLDVTPEHTLGIAGAEGLHGGFLRREPTGKMNRWRSAARAVGYFAVSEHAAHEPVAVTLDDVGDSMDIRGVQPESDDVRHATA